MVCTLSIFIGILILWGTLAEARNPSPTPTRHTTHTNAASRPTHKTHHAKLHTSHYQTSSSAKHTTSSSTKPKHEFHQTTLLPASRSGALPFPDPSIPVSGIPISSLSAVQTTSLPASSSSAPPFLDPFIPDSPISTSSLSATPTSLPTLSSLSDSASVSSAYASAASIYVTESGSWATSSLSATPTSLSALSSLSDSASVSSAYACAASIYVAESGSWATSYSATSSIYQSSAGSASTSSTIQTAFYTTTSTSASATVSSSPTGLKTGNSNPDNTMMTPTSVWTHGGAKQPPWTGEGGMTAAPMAINNGGNFCYSSMDTDSVFTTMLESTPSGAPMTSESGSAGPIVTVVPMPVNNAGNSGFSSMGSDAGSMMSAPTKISMTSESVSMTDDQGTTADYGSTTYYIRIGATDSPTLTLSTIVLTTYSATTHTSNSHTFSTLLPVTSTIITLVHVPTQSTKTMKGGVSSSSSTPKHLVAIVVAGVLSFLLLLLALIAAWFLLRRRRRRRQQQQRAMSGSDFFPEPTFTETSSYYSYPDSISRPVSVRTVSDLVEQPVVIPSEMRFSIGDLELQDQLDLDGPPLQASSDSVSTGLFLTETLNATSPGAAALSRPASLREQTVAVQREISLLERRASVPRDVEEGYTGEEGGRIEELRAMVRELERERKALRLQLAMGDRDEILGPPPEYTT